MSAQSLADRPPPETAPAPRRRRARRAVSLKSALMARIVAVALASFAAVMVIVLFDTRLETGRLETDTLHRVARHLELQQLRINSEYEPPSSYPDWDLAVGYIAISGQCVRLDDTEGQLLRNTCIGSVAAREGAPGWFAGLYGLLLSAGEPAVRPVIFKGRTYGTLRVSTDPAAAVAVAWRETRRMLGLTAFTVLSLCLLSWLAIGRALAPARAVVAGLDRLAGGDFGYRLPGFRYAELQRIGEVANQLAATIEETLAERARLSQRLVDAQEEERRHLARELHDEFGQNLTAIGALAASIERAAGERSPDLRDEARSLSRIARAMMAALRDTLLHLRPAELDRFGLVESLRQLVEVWNRSSPDGPRFELEAAAGVGPLPEAAAVHVYRIAQEGLTNAARHATGARRVRLALAPAELARPGGGETRGIRLLIEDDGAGRNEERPDPGGEAAGSGRGILNMRERVAALGGSIVFEERPGGGLRVSVQVPVQAPAVPETTPVPSVSEPVPEPAA